LLLAIVDEGFAGTAIFTSAYGTWTYTAPFIKFLSDNSSDAISNAKDMMKIFWAECLVGLH
jgi:hypothetical protein